MIKSRVVAIVGPAGSGKSTLCQKLADSFGYQAYFCGEIYRQAKSENSPEYQQLEKARLTSGPEYKRQLNYFIIDQLRKRINHDDYVMIEGFKDADFYAFTKNVCPIDLVIILNGHPSTLVERILERDDGREEDNKERAERRVTNYYRFEHRLFRAFTNLKIKSLIFDVDQSSIDEIIDELRPRFSD